MKNSIESIFLNEEKCLYSIKMFRGINRIDEIGKMIVHLKKDDDEIEILNETELFLQGIKEITDVKVRKADFLPISYESSIIPNSKDMSIIGEYKKRNLLIRFLSKEKKKVKIHLPDVYYDNSSMIYLMRAFAFNLINNDNFYVINPKVGSSLLTELKITGEEVVKCELGEFKCIGVKLTISEYPQISSQKFLYNLEEPHYLIKNIADAQIIEIKEILTV